MIRGVTEDLTMSPCDYTPHNKMESIMEDAFVFKT